MLKRLYVDNFRCLGNFELTPGRVATLVGPNGSGKSTVLDVLSFIQSFLVHGEPFPSLAHRTLCRWDHRVEQRLELSVHESGVGDFDYCLTVRHDPERKSTSIVTEELRHQGQILFRFTDGMVQLFGDAPTPNPRAQFAFDPRRSFLPLLEPRPDNRLITAFKRWLGGILLFRIDPKGIEAASERESAGISIDGHDFTSWFRSLAQENPSLIESLRSDLSPVIGGLTGFSLVRAGADSRLLTFQCKIGERTALLTLDELSDGQRILVVLYTILRAIEFSGARLVVFDEPDNFVAIAEIQPWLSRLREATLSRGASLLLLSHHPEVVDYLAADQTILLWREAGGPTRQKFLDVDRASGLTASEWLKLGAVDVEA